MGGVLKGVEKIIYIAHYSDTTEHSNRKAAPSADTKLSYIISVLQSIGLCVEVWSLCAADDRNAVLKKYPMYCIERNGILVRYFDSYASRFKIFRLLGRIYTKHQVKQYVKNLQHGKEKVILYHSLGMLYVLALLRKIRKPFILETEELYADVMENKRIRKKELRAIRCASGYIFPTRLLNEEVNVQNKPAVYVHGTYQVEKEQSIKRNDGKIHVVYAGTLDSRKGGAIASISAAAYLPAQYHVHILGFGSDADLQKTKALIEEVSQKTKAKVSYDGLLSGDDYIKFIQSCDIGLSTQNPDAAFNATSFPSKILSYMANGLRVVSIRIPAIETSAIGNDMYYYDNQMPEEIARAIMDVDFKNYYDGRELISKLDRQFKDDARELLHNLKV